MKKISLGVVAVLIASATVFASGPVAKSDTTKTKKECQGTCQKKNKTGNCTHKDACSDMKTCGAKCS